MGFLYLTEMHPFRAHQLHEEKGETLSPLISCIPYRICVHLNYIISASQVMDWINFELRNDLITGLVSHNWNTTSDLIR